MADVQVPSIATATPAAADTVVGVQGGAVKRFGVDELAAVGAFTQAGDGAVARSVQAKLRDAVSVRDFGAVGDGVTDDTAAIIAALAAAQCVVFPHGTYRVTSTITLAAMQMVRFDNATLSSSMSGPTLQINRNGSVIVGHVSIICDDAVGSIGLQVLGSDALCADSRSDSISVQYAATGVQFLSNGNFGVYYHYISRLQIRDCETGLELKTTSGGANPREINANHFGHVTLQRCDNALVVDGADFAVFDWLEAENNTGDAINLVVAKGFTVNGGWIEGNGVNFRIANYPDVIGVYIRASIDSSLSAADAKFIFQDSVYRSVRIDNDQYSAHFGRARFTESVRIGKYGEPANDQGPAHDGTARLQVATRMDVYRHSVGAPFFFFSAASGTGVQFQVNGSTNALRLSLDGRVMIQSSNDLHLTTSSHSAGRLRLGSHFLWVDSSGNLRIKPSEPSSDTDGTVVGAQS